MFLTSRIISYIFHPLLMLTYIVGMLLVINPYIFGFNSPSQGVELLMRIFFSSFFLPALCVFLMYKLEFISSIELEDRQERIIPYIASGVFYLWVWQSVKSDTNSHSILLTAVLGTTVALFSAFVINLFWKISLHAVGVGGLIGILLTAWWFCNYGMFSLTLPVLGTIEMSINLLIIFTIFIAGIVCSARLYLQIHTPKQLYAGLALGLLCMFIAHKIVV